MGKYTLVNKGTNLRKFLGMRSKHAAFFEFPKHSSNVQTLHRHTMKMTYLNRVPFISIIWYNFRVLMAPKKLFSKGNETSLWKRSLETNKQKTIERGQKP